MQRIQSLDLARGFTVLFIPAIHTVMLYSKLEVHHSWLGYPLQFIAEGPGGQLLMLLMGIVFSFRKKHSLPNVIFKSLALLVAGYLLNFIKYVLLFQMGLLPMGLQKELQLETGRAGFWQLFLLGDILHFAAIAIIILYIVHQSRYNHVWAILLCIIIIVLSPFIWDAGSINSFIDYLLQLASGHPPRVFFPLFPWLVYPLLGFSIGYLMKRLRDGVYPVLLKLGGITVIIGYTLHILIGEQYNASFYRTWPWDTLWHVGIVLLTIFFWQWISVKFSLNLFFQLLNYCSRNITQIYIIQWILICWLLPFFGYQQLGLTASVVAILLTTSFTFLISVLITNKYCSFYSKV